MGNITNEVIYIYYHILHVIDLYELNLNLTKHEFVIRMSSARHDTVQVDFGSLFMVMINVRIEFGVTIWRCIAILKIACKR